MRKFTLKRLGWAGLPLFLLSAAQAAVSPEQWLLEQIRLGEATHRDDLVKQSLYRLELMDPDNPNVIAARLRLSLRQGDQQQAQQQLDRLAKLAPDSGAYRDAKTEMMLASPEGRQQLQQARLLAAAGRIPEAVEAYHTLFGGTTPPSLDLAVEYWRLVARQPGQRKQAIARLQTLNQQYPGSGSLRNTLANLLFDDGQSQAGFLVVHQMLADVGTRSDAADIWLAQIDKMPVSDASVAQLQSFLLEFTDGDDATKARQKLTQQQALLADPAFRARTRGLALVDNGKGAVAIPDLKRALAEKPDDGEVLGALGQAYARQGNRAKALQLLEQAAQADTAGYNNSKWQSLIKTNRYWLLIKQGDNALQARQLGLAERFYRQAQGVDNTDGYAPLGLGDVAVARNDDAAAERFYQRTLRLDPGNGSALRGLVKIYQRQSPDKALAYLNQLPRNQRNAMRDTLQRLQADALQQEAETLEKQQQWAQAADKLRQALALTPDDVWLTYHLAKDLREAGQPAQADALFRALAQKHPADPQQVYACALYLSGSDRDDAALAQLNTLPKGQWDDNIRELAQRLQLNGVLQKANALRATGHEQEAIAYLQQQPANTRIDLTLADWALAREDYDDAQSRYQRVAQREPENADARLGEVETFIAQGKLGEARAGLSALKQPAGETPSLNTARRVANAWSEVGDASRADPMFRDIARQALTQPPGQDSALALRDVARYDVKQHQPQQALDVYRNAMVASQITPAVPRDNDTFTRLMRNNPADDWLKRGIRADAADLYRQQDVRITLDHDYWGSSGTKGYSDLTAQTTMLQADAPLYDGRTFLRTDYVQMDAGTFGGDGDGKYYDKFGTCAAQGCSGSNKQRANGASLAAGWSNDTWSADIGTTPLGFDVVDWVGGLSYSSDWNHIGWTVNAHRRPISSSQLSFSGRRDPNTGITWGGVRANGVSLSGSYDRGGANGVWGDLSADQLTGKNVADNNRVRLMGGYYYKLINEDNRRVSVGLSSMLWHYQKDLSGYTLGQGGYYSPQRYFSLAVPVNYRQRTENWSWDLGGSVSWSRSTTKDQKRYPLQNLVPDSYADKDAIETGSTSSGFGYTLRAVVERRLSAHWTLGAGVDIQEAKDYTPSHALLYVRYSMAGWEGDLDMPPQPLIPYADFK